MITSCSHSCEWGGPIPSVLSGCSVGNSGNGVGISFCLQKAVR